MVYFFNIVSEHIRNKIAIPKYNNQSARKENALLYSAKIINSQWFVEVFDGEQDDYFWYYNSFSGQSDVSRVFFISDERDLDGKSLSKLPKPSDFTNTKPDYRCNLQVLNMNGGHSSYQAEYPFKMTQIRSPVISSIRLLTSRTCKNWLYFRNIEIQPSQEKFEGAFVNLNNGEVVKRITGHRNNVSIICIDDLFEKGDIWFTTKDAVGVPIYISEGSNGELSMEHTHPPHEAILGPDKFQVVRFLKEKIYGMAFD